MPIGLTADAADGLLSGRLSAAEFRATLRDDGCGPANFVTEAPAEPTTPDAQPAPEEDPGQSVDVHIKDLHAIEYPVAKANAQSWPRGERAATVKQQLLAACQAAEHWLQAERSRPDETRPDDILRVLRAAIARAEGQLRSFHHHDPLAGVRRRQRVHDLPQIRCPRRPPRPRLVGAARAQDPVPVGPGRDGEIRIRSETVAPGAEQIVGAVEREVDGVIGIRAGPRRAL